MAATKKPKSRSDESPEFQAVIKETVALLLGGYSHARFENVVNGFPVETRAVAPEGVPYSAWQIIEHMRRVQRHMLVFTAYYVRHSDSKTLTVPKWPPAYWVREASPPDVMLGKEQLPKSSRIVKHSKIFFFRRHQLR